MTLDLKFYASIFLRRLPYFLIVAVLVTALGVSLAVILPSKYRAQTLLLVESPQIPTDLATSTVRTGANEGLQLLEQLLMTRANLLDLANRFEVYRDRPGLDPTAVVADMRSRIEFAMSSARSEVTTLTVSFVGASAEQALQVTNELVTQALQQNVEMRTGRAGQTLDFFRQEVDRLGADLNRQEAVILAFYNENQESLPDSMDFRRARQAALQERLLQLQREAGGLGDRRLRLVALYERTGRIEARPDQMTPEQRQLQAQQAELASALLIYSPQNPTVKLLQARVAALERVVAEQAAAAGVATESGAEPSLYEVQLAEIDGEMAYIADQQAQVEAELAKLKTSIEATPANAARLAELEREHEITQGQYNTAVESLAQAQTGERIEVLSKGQRISVVEQAVLPTEPYSPQRKLIAAGSLAGGLALGGAFVLLLELMNRSIRRPAEIVARLGITPIATLPYIRTRRQTVRRRGILALAFFLAVFGVFGGLYGLHVYYMPLDLLVERVIEKAGLSQVFGRIQ